LSWRPARRILEDPGYRPVFIGDATQLPALFFYLFALAPGGIRLVSTANRWPRGGNASTWLALCTAASTRSGSKTSSGAHSGAYAHALLVS